MTNYTSPAPASHPLAVAKHWVAAYRWGKLDVLLSLYDEHATTECHCERISLPFRVNNVALTADGVRLNYQDYEGKSIRMDLRFGPSGKIVHTTWRENPSDNTYSHGHQASRGLGNSMIRSRCRMAMRWSRYGTPPNTSPHCRSASMTPAIGRTR